MQTELTELPKVKMFLVGQDGNAFALMGAFSKAARRQGWNSDQIRLAQMEMMEGDYDHLLRTLMKYTEEPDEDD